jgi:hypothetical protein
VPALLACLLGIGCSSGPPPRGAPIGTPTTITTDDGGELHLRYTYQRGTPQDLQLTVELQARRRDMGTVRVAIEAKGFDVLEGPLRWTVDMPSGAMHSHTVHLRATAPGVSLATVQAATFRDRRELPLASEALAFYVTEHAVRPCTTDDPPCVRALNELEMPPMGDELELELE